LRVTFDWHHVFIDHDPGPRQSRHWPLIGR
jgi:hypothetical protein